MNGLCYGDVAAGFREGGGLKLCVCVFFGGELASVILFEIQGNPYRVKFRICCCFFFGGDVLF